MSSWSSCASTSHRAVASAKRSARDYQYAGLDYAAHREALLTELRPFVILE